MTKLRVKVKRRNHVARDLRTPKYRMRVVENKKRYKRVKRIDNELE